MKTVYSQPILLIQSFKLSDTLMASGRQCHNLWCSPNGSPSQSCPANAFCPANCYSCGDSSGTAGWEKDYGMGEAK